MIPLENVRAALAAALSPAGLRDPYVQQTVIAALYEAERCLTQDNV